MNGFTDKLGMFENRLIKVYKHRSKIARRQNISCYRLYDHDLPEFPFCIELYGDNIYLAEYRRRHHMDEQDHVQWLKKCEAIISAITNIPDNNIYLRTRQRKPGRTGQYQKQNETKKMLVVEENGLKFLVNLTDYLDTGLFLDHRITRTMVREEAAFKHVLNLFCYTGSFSVYAASGNAASVTSVDLSKTYLSWAQKNFLINGFSEVNKYHFIHADVKQYIQSLKPFTFDVVVMDPPTFSNSKRMKDFLDIQRDHVTLLNEVLNAMNPNGVIFFSTNYSRFVLDSDKLKAAAIKDITKMTTPFDFEGKLNRWCYKIFK